MNDEAPPIRPSQARSSLVGSLINVQPGEGRRLILCALYFFLVLFSYYMLRPVRETMGVEGGFDKLPLLMTGTLLVMLLVNPIYAWFVSRVPRRVFIPWTYRFFILNILVFFGLLMFARGHPPKELAYAFYIWLSVFNLFVVSIFWSVMSDVHDSAQAKRLFGAIGVGGTLGAMGGAAATGYLSEALQPQHFPYLLLASAMVLETAVWVAIAVFRHSERAASRDGISSITCASCGYTLNGLSPGAPCPKCGSSDRAQTAPVRHPRAEPSSRPLDGFKLIAGSPYLQKIALYMLLFTITATVLYVEQARVISTHFPDRAARTKAFASLDLWTNAITLFTQLFLTARIIRWIGLTGSLLVVPIITLIGFGAMAWMAWSQSAAGGGGGGSGAGELRAVFIMLFVFQVARRGLHYAIDRPARETLYTITSVDEKYKSKAFIDTFVYRLGDQIGAWGTVGAYATLSAATALGVVAMPVALIWIGTAFLLGRAYDKRTAPAE